jgi:hypothetical protein
MKILLVISSVHPKTWTEEQKEEFDRIEYVEFPKVNPKSDAWDVAKNEVQTIQKWIEEFINKVRGDKNTPYIYINGESLVCYEIFLAYKDEYLRTNFVFPSFDENGKFVRWR